MDVGPLITAMASPWSPLIVGALVMLATVLVWMSFAPARQQEEVDQRLDGYLDRGDVIDEAEMSKPFTARVVGPGLRRVFGWLGRLAPKGSLERTQALLVQAGEPGHLSAFDFFGLQLLFIILLAGGYLALILFGLIDGPSLAIALRNALILAIIGFLVPYFWLRSRARRRQHEIQRALPDALDMLTIGVEAGLAFETAMLRVGEQWDNALSRELRRTVAEMRVGTARDEALQRLVARTDVPDLSTFVTVLIQSSQLGVSIGEVLHAQAAEMRLRRRQRAEELARQAGVKMVFPLVFLIFPALFVVILGPALPGLLDFFSTLGGGP